MAQRARNLYQSSNGDRWSLVRDLDSGRVFIRHEPNRFCRNKVACYAVGDKTNNVIDEADHEPSCSARA
jgi:hypothetical protein